MTSTLSRTIAGSTRPLTSPSAAKKHRRRWVGRAVWGGLAAGGVAGLAWAWQPKPVAVDVAAVSRGSKNTSSSSLPATKTARGPGARAQLPA